MVNWLQSVALAGIALSCVACFDPQTPPECKGAVCGQVNETSSGNGSNSSAANMGGGHEGGGHQGGGHMGGGHMGGGHMGGGGHGGGGHQLTINIDLPMDGATFNHGVLIDFAATVTHTMQPSPDQLIWRSSEVVDALGVGYMMVTSLDVVGMHTITVSVMEGDTTIASDSIMVQAF